ncbi:hypothetical protein HAX54_030271 [Datura stramonium]|uniref:Uncharacterized protein n=1 Tax=Datura stramonium TaxID=4076 RepID=A0ABS8VAC0_DATST|nr:hypothetical protein [Datura stramonium]
MLRELRGSNSDDADYAIFINLKESTKKAIVEGEKEEECNTDCVIQSLANCINKDLQRTFFGSNIEFDSYDRHNVRTCLIVEHKGYYMCKLFHLYLAEEFEKNKMASSGAYVERRTAETEEERGKNEA